MRQVTAGDVMTRSVVTSRVDEPLKIAVSRMIDNRVGLLPVTDDARHVLGVLSESDVIRKQESPTGSEQGRGRWLRRFPERQVRGSTTGEIMTTPTYTVEESTTLPEAARIMDQYAITHLPVLDSENRLIGIVARADLLSVYLKSDQEIHDAIYRDIIDETMMLDRTSVTVAVENGVVTLAGRLESRNLVPILVQFVSMLDGVVGVKNHLTYREDTVGLLQQPPGG